MVKWSSFLVSEWLDLLVSSVKVTIVLELYRRKWQGGNMYAYEQNRRKAFSKLQKFAEIATSKIF